MSELVLKPTILIVDDAPESLDIIKAILVPYFQVKAAKSGALAIKIALLQQPDLILLDIMMPEMNGYEVCQYLKNNPATQHIPIIFLTVMSSEQDELFGFKHGVVDYITKPVNPAIVLARVRTHIHLKSKTDMLEQLVALDGLTAISNRRAFDTNLNRLWKQAIRLKMPISLIMIDIDRFKQYNDHYGHNKGDDCLKLVAKTLNHVVKRPDDMVARFGGEEFAAILPGTDQEGAHLIGDNLVQAIRDLKIKHANADGINVFLSISAGIATMWPEPNDKVAALLERTDKMLYQAKSRGRDQLYFEWNAKHHQ